jgi:patatin-related protein
MAAAVAGPEGGGGAGDGAGAPGYDAELRLGVVMYGGVSLAIYIHGVARELHELACATPRAGPLADAASDGTRRVYRWLAALLADEALRDDACAWLAADPARVIDDYFAQPQVAARLAGAWCRRFVVDVVAGTSAGGINGLFLARALANGEPLAPLRELWLREADIGRLIHDAQSRRDDPRLPPLPAQPASLLDSDRMYRRLLDALGAMTREATDTAPAAADELDLYVTTTDIRGSRVALQLADRVVGERRHRQVFHLRYEAGGAQPARNDFVPANDAFLAFVARCTSAFPFAFEPMTLAELERVSGAVATVEQRRRWARLFARGVAGSADGDPDGDSLARAYGDGGYLDNKPFGHAIAALCQREADLPVERKLIYIEPSPDGPGLDGPDDASTPHALDNALAALLRIPRTETIAEDLQALLQRNRRIERVEAIALRSEAELEAGVDDDAFLRALADNGGPPDWDALRLAELRRYYGDAFVPYRWLRVALTTDRLARHLATLWGVDRESDRGWALRALLHAWREHHYADAHDSGAQTLNAYLGRYDLRYRLRRLHFLLRRLDALHGLLRAPAAGGAAAVRSELQQRLAERLWQYGLGVDDPAQQPRLPAARAALAALRERFVRAREQARAGERAFAGLRGEAARAERERLAPLLHDLLDQLLGAPLASDAGGNPRPPLAARPTREVLGERARQLYAAIAAHDPPALQRELHADLDAIAVQVQAITRGTPQQPALAAVAAALGGPQWVFAPAGADLALADAQAAPPRWRVEVGATGEPVLDTPEGHALRSLLGASYLRFDSFDQMRLPLHYGTDTGEPATVDVIRISPQDATALVDELASGRRKLAGTALANFGGFLDDSWRRNDLLWGRLDGAERLIGALLPQRALQPLRAALVDAAQRTVARETLAPAEREQLAELLRAVLDRLAEDAARRGDGAAGAAAGQTGLAGQAEAARLRALLAMLDLADPARRAQIEDAVASLLDERGVLGGLRDGQPGLRALDPGRVMGWAARALTVTGRVLEGIAEGRAVQPLARWLARAGLLAQGLLAVATPGSVWALVGRHGLILLYLFAAATVALGTLLAAPETRNAGLGAFALLFIAHAAIVLTRDRLRGRAPWRSRVAALAIAGVVALAAVGGWTLYRVPVACLTSAAGCVVG